MFQWNGHTNDTVRYGIYSSGIPSYTELVAYAKTVDEKDTVSVLNNDTENVQVSDTDEKDIVSILNDDIKDVKVFDTDAQEKRIDLSKEYVLLSFRHTCP